MYYFDVLLSLFYKARERRVRKKEGERVKSMIESQRERARETGRTRARARVRQRERGRERERNNASDTDICYQIHTYRYFLRYRWVYTTVNHMVPQCYFFVGWISSPAWIITFYCSYGPVKIIN